MKAILVYLGFFLIGTALAQSPVQLIIDTHSPGYTISDDFCGLSFGAVDELTHHGGVSGCLFSATNSQLITLFKNSGIRNLRLGGSTVDGLKAALPTYVEIDNVFGFAKAADVKVIYSLRLLNGNPAQDVDTAKYIWSRYRARLECFAIGNEPDINRYFYPPFGSGTDPAITNYSSYLVKWKFFAVAITSAIPDAKFAGPDAAGKSWAAMFARDEKNSGIVALVTQHYYAGGSPFLDKKKTQRISAAEAIDRMLSPNWISEKYPGTCGETVSRVMAEGLPCRMTEADDFLKGVRGASDAFASVLWALDFLHWWAARGCAGVNFHNTEWLKTDTVYFDGVSESYRINPKAYAIKAFDLGSHGCVEKTAVKNPDRLNFSAYAVGDSNEVCITLINKEHAASAREAAVTIALDGFFPAKKIAVMFLTASGVAATNGIALGGEAIENDSRWSGKWNTLNTVTNNRCTLIVPAASATIIKVSAR